MLAIEEGKPLGTTVGLILIKTVFPLIDLDTYCSYIFWRTFLFLTQSSPVLTYPWAHPAHLLGYSQTLHFYGQITLLFGKQE